MMITYFCLLVSVLVCKNYAEMICQTVQQKTTAMLSCDHSEGDVTWSRDQDGGRVNILTMRKGQDSEDKHIHDPGKRFSSGADKSLNIFRVNSSDSGVYYCNGEPVVNLTVTPDVTMTPHTTKNPTTRVKNAVTTRTVSVAEVRKFNINVLPKKKREKRKKKEDKEGKKKKKDDKTNNDDDDDDDDDDNDDDDNDGEDVTMTTHTTKNPTTRVKNTDVPMTPHTTKNPTTRVKNTVTTWTVSVAKESEATKTDEKKDKKSEKNKGLWQLPLGVAAGGLVLVLLLVGFLIRRSWARKAEVDRDRPPAVYAEISDVTQQPKDESCSSRSKEHSVYYLAGAPGTQEEVIGMKPIYHTIQDPNITTNLSNGENPYCLAQNPDVPKTSFD